MKHILCAIDGSDHGKRAVSVAAAMALRMQTKLSILHVSEYVVGRGGVYDVSMPGESEKYLAEAKAIASNEAYGDPALKSVRARDPAHAILEFAEKNEIDHIVMGAAGKGAVKAFLIGSVSSDVLRKSHWPVTIVR
jgi:nucleotide-binding universal stress UspA family protein